MLPSTRVPNFLFGIVLDLGYRRESLKSSPNLKNGKNYTNIELRLDKMYTVLMIYGFSAKNFFSFKDRVEIQFYSTGTGDGKGYHSTESGDRVSLVECVIGPNASGKSTALKAITALQWLIVYSFRDGDRRMPVEPFAGNNKENDVTELSVEFSMDNTIHRYVVELNKHRILSEALHQKSLTNMRTTYKKLFTRVYDQENKCYKIEDSAKFSLKEDYWANEELRNSSIISATSRFGHDYSQKIIDYWMNVSSTAHIRHRYYFDPRYHHRRSPRNIFDSNFEEDIKKYADLGIHGMSKSMTFIHKYGDTTYELDIDDESEGTKKFVESLELIGQHLKSGGLVVIDELDAFLHTEMFLSLVKKFQDPKVNVGNGQLLFTAHNLFILNELNRDQINLADKSKGATEITRLDEKQGVRATDNFLKKYIGRSYGAFPKIED